MQKSIVEWLEITAKNHADKIAIQDSNESITYEMYRKQSIAIARAVIEVINMRGLDRKTPVVVYLEKSKNVLISFMGIAYSGCFYSPIDIDVPKTRIKKIFDVLSPKIVITKGEYRNEFSEIDFCGDFIFLEDIEVRADDEAAVLPITDKIIDTDLLYVLFTSGSTGTPKGVSICHRSVIDYIDWVAEKFEIEVDDSFGNQAPFFFDNSILDIYTCIKTGATLYIIPQYLFCQPVKLLEYLAEHNIRNIFWVPSALSTVSKLKALKNVDLSKTLRRVMFCGEVMPNKQLNIWRSYLPKTLFVNLYGPTEITDACTYYIVNRSFSDDESLPIGYPIRNTEILVLNEHNESVVDNESGELCVRGSSLALGYYNNPEKTGEVFVQNPLNKNVPEIIYKTGDLVRYNDKGELEYICRKDFQIKHLGHRIELGEIETVVSAWEEVTMCCCLYDDKRQCIVLLCDFEFSKEVIRKRIKEILPEYMCPGKVIYVETLPLNANGKIDRVKLKELYL